MCRTALTDLAVMRAEAESPNIDEGTRMIRLAMLREKIAELEALGIAFEVPKPVAAVVMPPAPVAPPENMAAAMHADGRDLRSVLLKQAALAEMPWLMQALERSFSDSFRFIPVAPGRFTMGTPHYLDERVFNEVQRRVQVGRAFEIQATPVTQAQIMVWHLAMGHDEDDWPQFRHEQHADGDHILLDNGATINYNHPAESINAVEAMAFVTWINELEAVKTSGCRYALPNERQWEWAIRSSVTHARHRAWPRPFAAGELGRFAFFKANSEGHTRSVELLQALPNGLRHMLGNVAQWTTSEPEGTLMRGQRIVRGGSFDDEPAAVRSAYRPHESQTRRSRGIGLRLIRVCP